MTLVRVLFRPTHCNRMLKHIVSRLNIQICAHYTKPYDNAGWHRISIQSIKLGEGKNSQYVVQVLPVAAVALPLDAGRTGECLFDGMRTWAARGGFIDFWAKFGPNLAGFFCMP